MHKNSQFTPAVATPAIEMKDVSKSFGDKQVLSNISLAVPTAQKVAIIGPSGSGKTTILRLLMTLEQPTSGEILIDGEPLAQKWDGRKYHPVSKSELLAVRSKIGMIFQQFNLFPHMTVLRNITESPIRSKGLSREQAEFEAMELLERVGLSDKAANYPGQLSGGQQQRVAIARALAMRPKIMLFDEVTSSLDPELVGEVLSVIRDLGTDTDTTMLLVTHEMSFARQMSDRVIFMADGAIVEDDVPEKLFSNPRSERTKRFLSAVLDR